MERLIAIDGNSLLYRAYYALPDMATRDGVPTGALHGFLTMLLKLAQTEPDYLAVAFDVHEPTFRHRRYAAYKAGRRETPEDLLRQFPLIRELLGEMGVTVCECPGYEADDILGTLARAAEAQGASALLVTGDRDALQLVSERTHVLLTRRGLTDTEEYTPELLLERYGLPPERMKDLKGLMGDASDNIPGIAGVGEKTALKLLSAYGDLAGVLRHADEIKGKLGERVRAGAQDAQLSLWLGTIDTGAPLPIGLADCRFHSERLGGAAAHLRALELRAVLSRLPERQEEAPPPQQSACERVPVASMQELADVLRAHPAPAALAVCAEGELSFAFDAERSYVVTAGETLFDAPLEQGAVCRALLPLLADAAVEKLAFDGKALRHMAAAQDGAAAGVAFDAMIADYLLNANRPAATAGEIAARHLGAQQATAALLFPLRARMRRQLESDGLARLYDEVELPLAGVLFSMEQEGFSVDSGALLAMQKQFEARAQELSGQIYALSGEPFNILSPKQLGAVLFEKLGLPPQRKTKSGYSTDADTLERLAPMHPIVPLVQEYRFVTKLKSTFLDGLLAARSADGRVHTRFQQCVTATGRISSAEPNLQNIPVRTPLGREIRKAFVASEGCVLIGADYSQIELRILAHLSGDEGLIAAFLSGEDVHRRTAAEVFGVPQEQVTPEMRSAAKAVNFGIVYGISDFGLAQNLNIPVKRAGEYIRLYLERYPRVKAFMEQCVEQGRARGYAVTMFGRRRPLPELRSGNYNTRAFGERVAMNMPIQGSAADIIKLAMVHAEQALLREGLRAKLILQVHDELIFDTPLAEQARVEALVHECMEQVAQLRVPLLAEVRAGRSGYDTKCAPRSATTSASPAASARASPPRRPASWRWARPCSTRTGSPAARSSRTAAAMRRRWSCSAAACCCRTGASTARAWRRSSFRTRRCARGSTRSCIPPYSARCSRRPRAWGRGGSSCSTCRCCLKAAGRRWSAARCSSPRGRRRASRACAGATGARRRRRPRASARRCRSGKRRRSRISCCITTARSRRCTGRWTRCTRALPRRRGCEPGGAQARRRGAGGAGRAGGGGARRAADAGCARARRARAAACRLPGALRRPHRPLRRRIRARPVPGAVHHARGEQL